MRDVMYIGELSRMVGVSVRTLRHYDAIGLLKPQAQSEAGYRLYGDDAPDRLKKIALLRELGFSLAEIGRLLAGSAEEWNAAMDARVAHMEEQRLRLENRITMAKGLRMLGVGILAEQIPDARRLDEPLDVARQRMAELPPMPPEMERRLADALGGFAPLQGLPVDSEPVRRRVRQVQRVYEEWLSPCTPQMLQSLGRMLTGGGMLAEELNGVYGTGTAEFAGRALRNVPIEMD